MLGYRQIDVKGAGDCLPNTVVLALFDYFYQTYIVAVPAPTAADLAEANKKYKEFLELINPDKSKRFTFDDFLKIVQQQVNPANAPALPAKDDRPYKIQEKYSPAIRELVGKLRVDPKYRTLQQTEFSALREEFLQGLLAYSDGKAPATDIFTEDDYNKLFNKALADLKWSYVEDKKKFEDKLRDLVSKEFPQIYKDLVDRDKKPGTWLGVGPLTFAAKYFGINFDVHYKDATGVITTAEKIIGTDLDFKWPVDPTTGKETLTDDEKNLVIETLRPLNILDPNNRQKFAGDSDAINGLGAAIGSASAVLSDQKYQFVIDWLEGIRDQLAEHTIKILNINSGHFNYFQPDAFAGNWDLATKCTVSPASIEPANTKSSGAFAANFSPKELADAKKFADNNVLTMKLGTSGKPTLEFYTKDSETGKDVLLFKDERPVVKTAAGKDTVKEFETAAKYYADRVTQAEDAATKAGKPTKGLRDVTITAANDEDLVKCRSIAEKYGLVVALELVDSSLAPPKAPPSPKLPGGGFPGFNI